MPTIAIAITTYNGAAYIRQQLQSLLDQTLKNFKVYIRDDHSTDNTVQIIQNFISQHHLTNWKLAVNITNLGWKINFWQLITNIKSDYLFIADQDDIWHPQKIAILLRFMQQDPKIKLLACQHTPFKLVPRTQIRLTINKNPQKVALTTLAQDIGCPGCTYLIDTSLIAACQQVWTVDQPYDFTLWTYAVLSGSAYYLPQSLQYWRIHTDSADYHPNPLNLFQLYKSKSTFTKRYLTKLDYLTFQYHFFQRAEKLNLQAELCHRFTIFYYQRYKSLVEVSLLQFINLQRYRSALYNSYLGQIGDLYFIIGQKLSFNRKVHV